MKLQLYALPVIVDSNVATNEHLVLHLTLSIIPEGKHNVIPKITRSFNSHIDH